ncbi:hypothetical protein BO70DRAFT_413562 [Aspergillus heteromorphus CBS 117.55]|uniref:PRISE-like Rossmann-fold domain-containing protein n=1 Tax=Aspergillus heteromorphus CBS 117.55 TaxID=1448321 RepID=A0A317VHM4_9EURO|nr:uncharacterized protein BO70DRAFT_413562 [Aspergillus heteromorphus CBS 117.55]PWY72959.1 hypothetical protein BO70DRAFT_413562 [Aspergillus heteromorphus CBS 117.55]
MQQQETPRSESGHHAVVFGCTGINGWALINQLLSNYPSPGSFSRVTAIANRAFTADEAQWPKDDRLQIVSGVDLLVGDDAALEKTLTEKIPSVETISHVYYAAYRASDNPAEECRLNKEMLRAAVQTLETLSPQLSFAYGVYLLDKFPFRNQIPLSEDLPRVPAEYAKDLFYYHEVDLLHELSANKSWSWCEVRPDVIVGVAPFGNANCMAQTLGIYLSIYRHIHGANARIPFPGTTTSWNIHSTDSNQDLIARFCIHLSLHPSPRTAIHTRAFNIADSARPVPWSERWPALAAHFGLVGVGPQEGSLHPTEFVERNWEAVNRVCEERGLRAEVLWKSVHNTGARLGSLRLMDFDRPFDLARARGVGFAEELGVGESWGRAFERVRGAGVLL